MRFEQLLAIFVLALTLTSVLALAGFWVYLFYMAFALNLYAHVIILAGLLTLFKMSKRRTKNDRTTRTAFAL
jgi:hypothetical protein